MSGNAANPYKAYSKANHTVPKTRQVVMLYDGIIRNLKQGAEAMKANDVEERYNKLLRASEIIMGLQSCLDFESGDQAARVLYDFYSGMDARIIKLHYSNNAEECLKIVDEIRVMRDMWDKIDKGEIDATGTVTPAEPSANSELKPAAAELADALQSMPEDKSDADNNAQSENPQGFTFNA